MRRAGALFLFASAFASACASAPEPPPARDEIPSTEVRRVWYPGREQLKKRYVVQIEDGRARKHGREEEWYEDGARKAEREFAHGEPAGTWRAWHPTSLGGAPESLVEIGDGCELLPMTWWYPDGAPRAAGRGRGGVREGEWTYYHPNGRVADAGAFKRGRRQWRWHLYYDDGRPRAEGAY
jgi:antitoxin component YwqK of YwqJK toxin-antitoxin module